MSEQTQQLVQAVLRLPLSEILALMDRLEELVEPLLAPPEESEYDFGPEHAEELRRRIEDHESGRTKPIPFDEAMKMIVAEGADDAAA